MALPRVGCVGRFRAGQEGENRAEGRRERAQVSLEVWPKQERCAGALAAGDGVCRPVVSVPTSRNCFKPPELSGAGRVACKPS